MPVIFVLNKADELDSEKENISEIKKMDLAGEFASLNLNLGAGRLNGVNSMIRFFQNL